MNKIYIKDLLVLIMTITIMILVVSTNLFTGVLNIGNYYLTYASILAAILYLILISFKNNEKLVLVLDVQRMDVQRLVTLLVYKFMYLSLIFTFIHTNQISFFIGLLIVFVEFFISTLNMIISVKNIQFTGSRFVLSMRDLVFNAMIIVLILNNLPFKLYSIPMDLILIALYTTILLYISYSLIQIIKDEL